jgi:dTDP-4-amino-4,6-dideoxygalactose transaminase
VKIITTGEGGMALTNDKKLADSMTRLRSHGITRDSKQLTYKPDGPWYYEQLELGFNFRMTDIQAALGLSQLGRLEEFVVRRNKLAQRYDEALAEITVQLQKVPDDVYSGRHLYVIRVPSEQHCNIFKSLHNKGIGVNLHYMPVHLQPYYKQFGFKEGDFPEAEKYSQEAISLPLYPSLTDSEQDHVIATLKRLI